MGRATGVTPRSAVGVPAASSVAGTGLGLHPEPRTGVAGYSGAMTRVLLTGMSGTGKSTVIAGRRAR
jgi:hypothetical protein